MATAEIQWGAAADLAQKLRKELLGIKRSVEDKVDRLEVLVDGIAVPTRWAGTRLEILGPDGLWHSGPDLRGTAGVGGSPRPIAIRISPDLLSFEYRFTDDEFSEWTSFADSSPLHGLYPFGAWDPMHVPYRAYSFGAHGNKLWLALRDTNAEPSLFVTEDWAMVADPTIGLGDLVDLTVLFENALV